MGIMLVARKIRCRLNPSRQEEFVGRDVALKQAVSKLSRLECGLEASRLGS